MRNPEKVLNSLTKHSVVSSYKFERLYRILFNPKMYYWAGQHVFIKPARIKYTLDKGPDTAISQKQIENLVGRIRQESYRPCPPENAETLSGRGTRTLPDTAALDDKLVQQIIRMILDAIYERQFEDSSHGLRPNRSSHTALMQVQTSYQQVKWFIEGHIKGFFGHISRRILIQILGERIADQRFLRLITKFVNAGYLQDWAFESTYSGAAQGGIISPVLANIYLDKLDKYMKAYAQIFAPGRLLSESSKTKVKQTLPANKPECLKGPDRPKALSCLPARQRAVLPFGEDVRCAEKELRYVRYADLFLIGVSGSFDDCTRIKQQIKTFLYEQLELELSEEKTVIACSERGVKFLSYQVNVNTSGPKDSMSAQGGDHKVVLRIPQDKIRENLLQCGAIEIKQNHGRQHWKPKSRSWLLNKTRTEIIWQYKLEIRAFYNYYRIAQNVGSVNTFVYLMQNSMYKTLGRKYRLSTGQLIGKFKAGGRFTAGYTGKEGPSTIRALCIPESVRLSKAPSRPLDQLPRSQTRHMRGKKHGLQG